MFFWQILYKIRQCRAWDVTVQNRLFFETWLLRLALKSNQFWAWCFIVFLQELHWQIINSEAAETRDCPETILFYKNCIEVETILSLRRDCSESILFCYNCIENEWILSLRRHCPEALLFFKNSMRINQFWSWGMTVQNQCFSIRLYSKSINSESQMWLSRINSFL